MFNGSMVALITPFSNGQVDEKSLARLVKYHLDNGTNVLVPVGTTGEASTLSSQEHKRVVELVVSEVSGQIPVIAGAGSNNITEAIEYAEHAADVGANAVLHVMGYYNRPNQEGIYQHFKALNETTRLPIVAYNVPSRAVIDILPDTMARIAKLENVVGVKDATADLSRPLRERLQIEGDFCYISGEDPTAVAYNVHGGQGCISVSANVAPALCSELQKACTERRYDDALEIQLRFNRRLHRRQNVCRTEAAAWC
ncbi:UNVERIFIED_CONTAM: hypothetical protein GTU68_019579 [Idotea baltica]|nr:hypothetical protein [Idotea baltica]